MFLFSILLLLAGLILGIIIHNIQEKSHHTRNLSAFIFKGALALSVISAILGFILLQPNFIYLSLFIFIPSLAMLAIDDLLSYE